ncbi:MAG: hypothetical protein JXQ71_18195 [Verrucomicrobia bacterium]|nr:hypothetical protein [Verrucomicrobiota bacterium]
MALALGSWAPARAEGGLETLMTNGPCGNRLDVVFFSEGYTSAECGQFSADAPSALEALLAKQPYTAYRSHFNAFAVFAASAQSGSDHPKLGIARDTYFNSTYDPAGDYVITIPETADGAGKLDALLQQWLPAFQTNRDLVVVLVNDAARGGSGGPRIITSKGATWEEVLVHESGHTLGRLGDEYEEPTPGFEHPGLEFPNVTTNTTLARIPWKVWIDPATPLPTPEDDLQYWDVIGLFEGANYSSTGWYRPKYDCLMRTTFSWSRFCEVCQEALVLAIRERVRPGEDFLPASTNLVVGLGQRLAFSVALVQPEGQTVRVQWCTNGMPVAGATHAAFVLEGAALAPGPHTVQARLEDHTAFVRSDPAGRLSQVQTWHIERIGLRLDPPRVLGGGDCYVRVSGHATGEVVLEGSTDLAAWQRLLTNGLEEGEWRFTNRCVPSHGFFRAVTTP